MSGGRRREEVMSKGGGREEMISRGGWGAMKSNIEKQRERARREREEKRAEKGTSRASVGIRGRRTTARYARRASGGENPATCSRRETADPGTLLAQPHANTLVPADTRFASPLNALPYLTSVYKHRRAAPRTRTFCRSSTHDKEVSSIVLQLKERSIVAIV